VPEEKVYAVRISGRGVGASNRYGEARAVGAMGRDRWSEGVLENSIGLIFQELTSFEVRWSY
jgi:hypothetical protein